MVERARLLRLLRLASPGPLAVYVVLGLVSAFAPVAMSTLAGVLAAQIAANVNVTTAVLVGVGVAVSIVVLEQANTFREPISRRVAASIDGGIRARVRHWAGEVLPFDVAESAEFQTDAAWACDPGGVSWRNRTVGIAAASQLFIVFRLLSTVALGVVISTVNLPVALIVVAGALTMRAIRVREWIAYIRVLEENAGTAREAEAIEAAFADQRSAREFSVFGFSGWLIERWRQLNDAAQRDGDRVLLGIVREQWLTAVIAFVVTLTAFGWLGFDALTGRVDAAELTVAIIAMTAVLGTAFMVGEAMDVDYGLSSARAYRRIENLAALSEQARPSRSPSGDVPGHPSLSDDVPPRIVLRDVTFGYGEHEVLRGVELELLPGERLAIVGRNGAGKSTLTRLLSGLYLPTSGSVEVDGAPTSGDEGHSIAGAVVATMNQEALRLPLDVRSNVTFGAEAKDDEVWEVLRIAGLADALTTRGMSLKTPLWSTTGPASDLSGGQWQRLALARAVFAARRGKRVLVLDEPTSQLDVQGETDFYNEIMTQLAGATVVLITHRLSTVRRADRIAFLADGRITELGTHDELVQRDGSYAAMFRAQADRFLEEGSR